MNQSRYIDKILPKFNTGDCKSISTLSEMDINKIIDNKVAIIDNKFYRKIMGSLIYIMITTRSDICYTLTRSC